MAHTLITGQSSPGVTNSIELHQPKNYHTVQSVITADTLTAVTMSLEGSLDSMSIPDADANWFSLGDYTYSAEDLAAKKAMFHVSFKSVPRIRVNVTTLTGTNINHTIKYIYGGA